MVTQDLGHLDAHHVDNTFCARRTTHPELSAFDKVLTGMLPLRRAETLGDKSTQDLPRRNGPDVKHTVLGLVQCHKRGASHERRKNKRRLAFGQKSHVTGDLLQELSLGVAVQSITEVPCTYARRPRLAVPFLNERMDVATMSSVMQSTRAEGNDSIATGSAGQRFAGCLLFNFAVVSGSGTASALLSSADCAADEAFPRCQNRPLTAFRRGVVYLARLAHAG